MFILIWSFVQKYLDLCTFGQVFYGLGPLVPVKGNYTLDHNMLPNCGMNYNTDLLANK